MKIYRIPDQTGIPAEAMTEPAAVPSKKNPDRRMRNTNSYEIPIIFLPKAQTVMFYYGTSTTV